MDHIDARARALGFTRSHYLSQIARKDITVRGDITIPAAEPGKPAMDVNFEQEIVDFLKDALIHYEECIRAKTTYTPDPPGPLAGTDLWESFVDQIEAISRHKWNASFTAGKDIGHEKAVRDWLQKYRVRWLEEQARENAD